ncbi:lipid-A-disaccharide synthase-like uncharacterized protein [Arcicella rosea]|uniref:MerC domain-containing protein n=1 Tax=Arcicella rosea TaxID=502909 RepID=UPI00345D6399
MKNSISKYLYDYLGIAGSGICLVHCLATPIVMFVKTFYETKMDISSHEGIHYWDYLFLTICFIAVYFTTKEATSSKITIAFWSFFVLFACSILFEEDFKYLNLVGYFSSIALIITHLVNLRNCKKCHIKNSQLQS